MLDLLLAAVGGAAAAAVAGGIVAAIDRARDRRSKREDALFEVARRARLNHLRRLDRVVSASEGDLQISLEPYDAPNEGRGTRVTIRWPAHPAGSLTVRPESLGTAVDRRLRGTREVEIGDPRFDDLLFVEGPKALALAVLTRPARGLLRRVLRGWSESGLIRGSLEAGVLQVHARENPYAPASEIEVVVPMALRLARGLQAPADLGARLAENLRTERRPQVRRRLVETLAAEFPKHRLTRPALNSACHDRSEDVRLQAAVGLRAEGRSTLVGLVASDRTSDVGRARGIAALGPDLPRDLLEATLRRALGSGARATVLACLESAKRSAAAEAEPLILQALDSEDVDVAQAAADALRTCGGHGAVTRLLELADTAPQIQLRDAARRAVAEIQARLPGAGRGQLSLAEQAGALSLAADADAGGALSLYGEEGDSCDEAGASGRPRESS